MSGLRGRSLNYFQWIWLIGSFSIILGLCVTAVAMPMRLGEKKILERAE
jgi:hypothetical protein